MLRLGLQTRFWVITLIVAVAAFWILQPVLLPFLIGMAVAYFLNPVVDRLESKKWPRWLSATVVLSCFALALFLLFLLIAPLLQKQIGTLISSVPGYVEKLRTHFIPWIENWLSRFPQEDVDQIHQAVGQNVGNAAGFVANAVKNILTNSLALLDLLALLVITPVVAFYFMRDWPGVIRTFDALIPRRHYDVVAERLREIDRSLSGFVRGQALVCLALGIIYGGGLTLTGLQYGAAIGVIAGILSFMPYIGTGFAWITSIILALVQFDDLNRLGFVIGVLVLGQILETYVLTPRLVGSRIGLHPVWVLFALLAGGRLAGFVGVLIAVPVAAVIGVLVRFALQQYRQSPLYNDPLAPTKP
ncbi:MAG: AI-2E family transporter [Bdellovibrionales bacterium]